VRLYRAAWSTNCERVTLALAHKGLAAEDVWIDYADRSPVEAISGQGLVPVLVDDDDTVVADSRAILRHLEATRPDPPLFAADPLLDVFIEWFDEVFKAPPNAIEAAEAAGAVVDPSLGARMHEWLEVFERMLAGRDHLFGAFGAADCLAYPFLKYGAGRDAADDERFHVILARELAFGDTHPRLEAWVGRMAAHPGAYPATF